MFDASFSWNHDDRRAQNDAVAAGDFTAPGIPEIQLRLPFAWLRLALLATGDVETASQIPLIATRSPPGFTPRGTGLLSIGLSP
jgi:hypothetical protein